MRRLIILFAAAILFHGIAASTVPTYFQNTLTRIESEYINPRGIDLKAWVAQIREAASNLCSATCTDQSLAKLLYDKVVSVGDAHFYVYNPFGVAGEKIASVGDARRDGRYGFLIGPFQQAARILYVHPGTPASKELKVGDIIRRVNDEERNLTEVLARAERTGQTIEIHYERAGVTRTTTLGTDSSRWEPQFELLPNKVLRIELTHIYKGVDIAVRRALSDAAQRGVRGIILDLRVCMGGDPFLTVNVAGNFLKTAGVSLKDRSGKRTDYVYSSGQTDYFDEASNSKISEKIADAQFWNGPLVVLTSGRTFSAGENLANILQAAGRVKVIGEVSVGGGGVTTNFFEVRRPTSVILPTYRHFDMTGQLRSLQVNPDVSLKFDENAAATGVDNQLNAALKIIESQK
jgi:C-terminal processing protease CtpA/Prc